MRNTLPESDYEKLVSEFGQSSVDYQIKRISEHHYKGCMNYTTIKDWCEERLLQMTKPQCPAKAKDSFLDMVKLGLILVCYAVASCTVLAVVNNFTSSKIKEN